LVIFGIFPFVVSEPLARLLIAKTTWLDPSMFPHAVTLMSYTIIALLLIQFAFFVVLYTASLDACSTAGNNGRVLLGYNLRFTATLDRFLSAIITIFFLLPKIIFLNGSPIMSSAILKWTSFTRNGSAAYVEVTSTWPAPDQCAKAAAKAGIPTEDFYVCDLRPVHCLNLPGTAQISFLPNSKVAVLEELPKGDPLSGVLVVSISIRDCDASQRFEVSVEDKGRSPIGKEWRVKRKPNFEGQ
jgi:hypothetical protein